MCVLAQQRRCQAVSAAAKCPQHGPAVPRAQRTAVPATEKWPRGSSLLGTTCKCVAAVLSHTPVLSTVRSAARWQWHCHQCTQAPPSRHLTRVLRVPSASYSVYSYGPPQLHSVATCPRPIQNHENATFEEPRIPQIFIIQGHIPQVKSHKLFKHRSPADASEQHSLATHTHQPALSLL